MTTLIPLTVTGLGIEVREGPEYRVVAYERNNLELVVPISPHMDLSDLALYLSAFNCGLSLGTSLNENQEVLEISEECANFNLDELLDLLVGKGVSGVMTNQN